MSKSREFAFSKIQNAIRGSQKPIITFSRFRKDVPLEYIDRMARWLPSVRRNGRPVFEFQYPKSGNQLLFPGQLEAVSAEKEVTWSAAVLKLHVRRLLHFRVLAVDFEKELLHSAPESALNILDLIERNFGISFWLIENMLATLQIAGGLEAQKAYLARIRHQSDGNPTIASYVAFYISKRNEDAVNPQRLQEELSARLSKADVEPSMSSYLKFRLIQGFRATSDDISNILRFEANSAIVDSYEAFVRFCTETLLSDDISFPTLVRESRNLAPVFSTDARLGKVMLALDGASHPAIRLRSDISDEDEFCTGMFLRSVDNKNLSIPTIVKAAAITQSEWVVSKTGFLDTLMLLATRVANKNLHFSESVAALTNIQYNLNQTGFANIFGDILADQAAPKTGPVFERLTAIKSFVSSPTLDPEVLPHLPVARRLPYAKILLKEYSTSSFVLSQILSAGFDLVQLQSLNLAESPLPIEAIAAESRIESYLRTREFEAAIAAAEIAAETTEQIYFKKRAIQYKAAALLQSDKIIELCEFIADQCVYNPSLTSLLPLSECAENLDKTIRREYSGKLAISIILDMCCKEFDEGLYRLRAYAYEDFLFAHGVEKPSELSDRVSEFNIEQLIYYLHRVCIPDIMQNSSAFRGTRELESERLAILAILVKLNIEDSKVYESETRKITRDQLIQRAVRDVEQSKIYVDTNAIRRWADQNLIDTFSRYQALRAAGIGAPDREKFQKAIESVAAGNPVPDQLLQLPTDEVSELLVAMMRSVLIQCSLNSVHGLDCYLSMRIRHGTLSGQLRSPLEAENLITYRETGSTEYAANSHWARRLSESDVVNAGEIAKRLAEFSAEYDKQIEWITNELIQIWSSDKPNGWFKISIPAFDIQALASQIDDGASFNEFVDVCFDVFWRSVDQCLQDISAIIENKIKPIFFALLEDLERDIHILAAGQPTLELDRAIRTARTSTMQAFDRVDRWFKLSKATTTPVSSFEDLLDVGLKGVTNIHPEFCPVIKLDIPDLPDLMGGLTLFSDIFFIVFDNIRKHSGSTNNPPVWIGVSKTDKRLAIKIENELLPGIRNYQTEAKVDGIRSRLEQGDYKQSVRSEGGSGLIKLRNLIGSEQPSQLHLAFGFSDADRFYVELEIPILGETSRSSAEPRHD